MREKEIRDLLGLARNYIYSEEVRTVAAVTALLEAVEMLVEDLTVKPASGSTVIYEGGWKELPAADDRWGPRTTRIEIVKAIRTHANISLREAKEIAETAWSGTPVRIVCTSQALASSLLAVLTDLGGKAKLVE